MNIIALKNACVIRWKNAINAHPDPRHKIIKPSCLKVDNATIFFMSFSLKADILAIVIVNSPTNIMEGISRLLLELYKWRNIKYTPAVTKVDECTREETGVGAAIAAGSQALNGIWALLVKAPAVKRIFKVMSTSINSL
jgi:hypothetical protein